MKSRIGLIMLGAGLLLLGLFFILYNPNAVLRKAAEKSTPPESVPTAGDAQDPARITSFLAAYNRQYAPLEAHWSTLATLARVDSSRADRYQLAAARRALLTFTGQPDNLVAIRKYFPLLTLPELQDRQIAVARRLAALRPGDMPAPMLELLDEPVADPFELPAVFRARNRAARSLGFESYLGLMASDLALDRDSWIRVLKSILEEDVPVARLVRATGAKPAADPSGALAFWQALDLPPLSEGHQPVTQTLEAVIQADIIQACANADLPPLLRGPVCRAFERALVHLAVLGAQTAGQKSLSDRQLARHLLQEAAAGPAIQVPLFAGAYLDWLEQMDSGLVAQPMVLDKYRRLVAEQVAAEGAGKDAAPAPTVLPAAAYGLDGGPVAPLDDILGWAIAHQLHRYICKQLLHEDVHRADYSHDHKVGDFLLSLLRQGRGGDWQVILRQATGEDFDPWAVAQYYHPLLSRSAAQLSQ